MSRVTTVSERETLNPFSSEKVVEKEVTHDDGSRETFEGRGPTMEEARANADNAIRSR